MMDLNWPKKAEYPSYLEIDLSFIDRLEHTVEVKKWSIKPWEIEVGDPYNGLRLNEKPK
jgi:hypothetical protein